MIKEQQVNYFKDGVSNLLTTKVFDNIELERSREVFLKNGIVPITQYINQMTTTNLSAEIEYIFNIRKRRSDFLSNHTDNTPRMMFSVNEKTITEVGKYIPRFYYSEELRKLISEIANDKAEHLSWEGERYVINALAKKDDTHGWHWDDYSYSVIFISKAPEKQLGGLVECVPNVHWDRNHPKIEKILRENKIYQYYFPSGSYYLMQSATTLHRVTQLKKEYEGYGRLAIAMSWCSPKDNLKDIDHKTVHDLYGA